MSNLILILYLFLGTRRTARICWRKG